MTATRNPSRLRRASTILLGAVLVLLAALAVARSRVLQEEEARGEARRAQSDLGTNVTLWEGLVTDRISTWLMDLPQAPDPVARERQIREKVTWFDAFYAWNSTDSAQGFTYPTGGPAEDLQALLAGPCMREAHALAVMGSRAKAATAFLQCGDGDLAEQLLASNLAASQYQELRLHTEAWRALNQLRPPLSQPLHSAARQSLSARRLVARRLLAAEILDDLERRDRAVETLRATFDEIVALSGPDLEALLPTAERLYRVELADRLDVAALREMEASLNRARHRVTGFQEIRQRLGKLEQSQITPTGPALPGGQGRLRVLHDMYSDPGFILVWAPVGDAGEVAAVHLDAEALLRNLLRAERAAEGADRRFALLDGAGQPIPVGGTPPETGRQLAAVSLGWLFPHLRLAVLSPPGEPSATSEIRSLVQLLPMFVAFALGVLAIAVQVAANRRERDFFERQQAFIARVTHELKTPLAGIRVMAETLQMGALSDPRTAKRFLDRIIHEADNLGQRIDEVLNSARSPQVSEKTPIRLEELASEVVETWAPRFQQAGATLETDLRACRPIPADPPLLRDALGNLLDNALKYRRPGVRGHCMVRTVETSRWVIFEVVDNGMGVPPAMRRRIFDRFSRVEGPGRGKSGGHGLGLSFVAEAAAAHRGVVECTEGLEGGARFRLKLRRRR